MSSFFSKVLKIIISNDPTWMKEASLLSRLSHENVVKYYDHFEAQTVDSSSHPCIVTEYCEVEITQ